MLPKCPIYDESIFEEFNDFLQIIEESEIDSINTFDINSEHDEDEYSPTLI